MGFKHTKWARATQTLRLTLRWMNSVPLRILTTLLNKSYARLFPYVRLGCSLTSLQGITATSWSSCPAEAEKTGWKKNPYHKKDVKVKCGWTQLSLTSTEPQINHEKGHSKADFYGRKTADLGEFARCRGMWGTCHLLSFRSWSHTQETASVFWNSPPSVSHWVPSCSCCSSRVSS